MRKFILNARFAGICVRLHWSVFLVFPFAWSLAGKFLPGLFGFVCFVALLVIHELGHAAVARKFRLDVLGVEIYPFHGVCRYEHPFLAREDYFIAWSGVAAQLLVLAIFGAAYTACLLMQIKIPELIAPGLFVFVWLNIVMIIFNLLPVQGLDGYHAWRIVRLLSTK